VNRPLWWETALLATLAMIAFAANSLLCRVALGGGTIDAASFTAVRLASGALTLVLIALPGGTLTSFRTDWRAASALFVYALCFSVAYLFLSVGTGALILFASVQLTMIGASVLAGERLSARTGLGLSVAIGGLAYLVAPGVTAPSVPGASLMAIAGAAWGVYSLRGRGAANPLLATAGNFVLALPMALLALLVIPTFSVQPEVTAAGIGWAVLSGALASGIGYVVWYGALRGLSAVRAATIQLSVPPIAAFGGIALLSESLSLRLILSSFTILGGIALVLSQRSAQPARAPSAGLPD
jgi:drug/metabolite transporter (DMT)-like permease